EMGGLGEAAELANGDKRAQQVRRDVGHSGADLSPGGSGSAVVARPASSHRELALWMVTGRRTAAWYQSTCIASIMPLCRPSCNFLDMVNEFKRWRANMGHQRCFRSSVTDASVVRLRLNGETKRPCLSIR